MGNAASRRTAPNVGSSIESRPSPSLYPFNARVGRNDCRASLGFLFSSKRGAGNRQTSSKGGEENVLLEYGAYLEGRQIERWKRQKGRRDITRVSLLSCFRCMESSESKFVGQLTDLLRNYAPHLQWLLLTGPLLLYSNEQTCSLLKSIHTQDLERLCLGMGQAASKEFGMTLAELISTGRQLKHVSLKGISFQNKRALEAIAQGIPSSSSLTYLDLTSCNITDEGLDLFVQALVCKSSQKEGDQTLQTLLLRGNNLTSVSLKSIAALVSSPSLRLTQLDISDMPMLFRPNVERDGNQQEQQHVLVFLKALRDSTSLKTLNLSFCGIDVAFMNSILDTLREAKGLECVDVNGNLSSRKDQIEVLTIHLPYLSRLTTLKMRLSTKLNQEESSDQIGSQAHTKNFLEALSQNWQLTHLYLDGKSDGADSMAGRAGRRRSSSSASGSRGGNSLRAVNNQCSSVMTDLEKISYQVKAVTQRNRLAINLQQSSNNSKEDPPLAVWSKVMATNRSRRRSDNGDDEAKALHTSLVHQILNQHLATIVTTH